MKYFSPSYWFKLWVLSAPLFNDKTQGINAKSIDNNQKIKDWASNNTNLQSINQDMTFINSSTNYQPYNLSNQVTNQNIDPIYQTNLDSISSQELETSTHKHRHEKSRNRFKRGVNGGNEIEYSGPNYNFYCSFKPEFWEEIIYLKMKYDKESFANKIKDKINNSGVWVDSRLDSSLIDTDNCRKKIGWTIYDNFWTIANKFIESSRRERIRIVINEKERCGSGNSERNPTTSLISVNIRTDDRNYYPNKYLDNLKNDLNGEDIGEGTVNLGVVGFYQYDHILKTALKKRYPNLDTSKFSIVDEIDYNPNQDYTQSFKIYMDVADSNYSFGNIKTKFIYTTNQFLTYILPRLIWENGNDLFTDWTNKVNNWKLRLDRQIMEDVPTFTQAQKRTWVDNQKTILEDKIHDAKQNLAIVDLRMKNKHLYKVVNQIEKDFDFLKNEINKLDKRVTNLENTSNVNCANIATIIAGVVAPVPIVGTAASSIATITAGACAIGGV